MKISIMTAVLLGSAGLACATGPAPNSGKEDPPFDWAGPYLGLNLGHARGDSSFVDSSYNGQAPAFPTVHWGFDSSSSLISLNAGRNWRRDKVVYGVEGEIGRLGLNGSRLQPGLDPFGDPYDASATLSKGWYGGLSGRLGYALDRTLVYAKAGIAYSRSRVGFLDSCTTPPCGPSTTEASRKLGWGYQLGVGVEHAMSRRWTLKAEYAYLDFDADIGGTAVGGGMNGQSYQIPFDLSVHTLRIGVNYKF